MQSGEKLNTHLIMDDIWEYLVNFRPEKRPVCRQKESTQHEDVYKPSPDSSELHFDRVFYTYAPSRHYWQNFVIFYHFRARNEEAMFMKIKYKKGNVDADVRTTLDLGWRFLQIFIHFWPKNEVSGSRETKVGSCIKMDISTGAKNLGVGLF